MVYSNKKIHEKDISLISETERHDYLINKTTGKAVIIPGKVKTVLKKFQSFDERVLLASNILGMAIHYRYNLIERMEKLKDNEKHRRMQMLYKFLRTGLLSSIMNGYFNDKDVNVLTDFLKNCPHGYEIPKGYIMVNAEFLPLLL